MDKRCMCTLGQSLTGDGCRYCQPQEQIDRLCEWLDEERRDNEALTEHLRQIERLASHAPVDKAILRIASRARQERGES